MQKKTLDTVAFTLTLLVSGLYIYWLTICFDAMQFYLSYKTGETFMQGLGVVCLMVFGGLGVTYLALKKITNLLSAVEVK